MSPREQAIAVYQQALMEAAEHPDPEIGRLVKGGRPTKYSVAKAKRFALVPALISIQGEIKASCPVVMAESGQVRGGGPVAQTNAPLSFMLPLRRAG